jgi:hypothetical protein
MPPAWHRERHHEEEDLERIEHMARILSQAG